LEWACENKVITDGDRALLLCLVEAADSAAIRLVDRRTGGLLANNVSEAVAQKWGIAPRTVRRRARSSMDALSSACTAAVGRIPA
jgi:hypothetical protein